MSERAVRVRAWRSDERFGYDRWKADEYSLGQGTHDGVLIICQPGETSETLLAAVSGQESGVSSDSEGGPMARGEVTVAIAGTREEPLIELEFWPPEGEPSGFRMPPESALLIVADLVDALDELGRLDTVS